MKGRRLPGALREATALFKLLPAPAETGIIASDFYRGQWFRTEIACIEPRLIDRPTEMPIRTHGLRKDLHHRLGKLIKGTPFIAILVISFSECR